MEDKPTQGKENNHKCKLCVSQQDKTGLAGDPSGSLTGNQQHTISWKDWSHHIKAGAVTWRYQKPLFTHWEQHEAEAAAGFSLMRQQQYVTFCKNGYKMKTETLKQGKLIWVSQWFPCRGHFSSRGRKDYVAMATGGCYHHMFHFSGDAHDRGLAGWQSLQGVSDNIKRIKMKFSWFIPIDICSSCSIIIQQCNVKAFTLSISLKTF